jgi:hypothetical protein
MDDSPASPVCRQIARPMLLQEGVVILIIISGPRSIWHMLVYVRTFWESRAHSSQLTAPTHAYDVSLASFNPHPM